MRSKRLVGLDSVLLLVLVIANLGMNLDHFYTPLDSGVYHALDELPHWRKLLLPVNAGNPLVFLGRTAMPWKLMTRSLTVLLLLSYLIADLLGKQSRSPRPVLAVKWIVISLIGCLLLVIPTAVTISARWTGPHHELAHDGGTIQVEEAIKLLLRGHNPYFSTYEGTPLENWRGFINTAVYHYPYLPFSFLQFVPFYGIVHGVLGFYDQRIAHLCLWLGAGILSLFLVNDPQRRLAVVMWVTLNPLFLHDFVLGTNDVVPMFWLLAGWALLLRKRWNWALLCLALGGATKQMALLVLPFAIALMLRERGISWRKPDAALLALAPVWVTLLIICAPFFISAPAALIEDTLLYSSGGLPTSYPIQGAHGYGAGTFLLFFKLIPNGSVRFPFWIFQVLLCGPLAIALLVRQRREPSTAYVFAAFSVFLLAFMFLARYLHGNFLGFILTWIPLAYVVHEEE